MKVDFLRTLRQDRLSRPTLQRIRHSGNVPGTGMDHQPLVRSGEGTSLESRRLCPIVGDLGVGSWASRLMRSIGVGPSIVCKGSSVSRIAVQKEVGLGGTFMNGTRKRTSYPSFGKWDRCRALSVATVPRGDRELLGHDDHPAGTNPFFRVSKGMHVRRRNSADGAATRLATGFCAARCRQFLSFPSRGAGRWFRRSAGSIEWSACN